VPMGLYIRQGGLGTDHCPRWGAYASHISGHELRYFKVIESELHLPTQTSALGTATGSCLLRLHRPWNSRPARGSASTRGTYGHGRDDGTWRGAAGKKN